MGHAMKGLFLALAVAATGVVVYHLGMRKLPPSANPMRALMVVYAVAFALAAMASPFFRNASTPPWSALLLSWPVLVVGAGVLLIEIGFLLSYRLGGSVQWAGVAVNGIGAILLLPFALYCFRETFSPAKAVGIVLTLSGLALMTRP